MRSALIAEVSILAGGGSVFVTSQGSGGAFVVELDAGDGSRRLRHDVGR